MTDIIDPSTPNRMPIAVDASLRSFQNGEPTTEGDLDGRSQARAFSRDLLIALLRFKDGDFGSRMPADFTGIDGKIADVFNEILGVSSRRAAEIARVCRVVGKEGKLKQRMN